MPTLVKPDNPYQLEIHINNLKGKDKEAINSFLNSRIPHEQNFAAALKCMLIDDSGKDGTDLAYKKIAQEFEQEFLSIMWNIAFETVAVDPLFGGGEAENTFRSLLVNNQVQQAYASHTSKIYEAVYNALRKEEGSYERAEKGTPGPKPG